MAPNQSKESPTVEMMIDIAILKENDKTIQNEIAGIKNEITGMKSWAQKVFWIIATVVIIQVTNFVINGGLSIFKIPH